MERREGRPGQRQDRRLEELEARAEAIAEELSYRERLEYEERHGAGKDARLAEGRGDLELDEAGDQSFPASDPASAARTGDARSQQRALDAELDEALDDTFPASDPPAILAPKGPPE
jgi:hypothetical protein